MSRQRRFRYYRVLFPLAMALALITITGCEPGPPVTYQNTTSQLVSVYEGGILSFTLEPHESKRIATLREYWVPNIKVVAADATVLLEDRISWDEMRDMDSKIVID